MSDHTDRDIEADLDSNVRPGTPTASTEPTPDNAPEQVDVDVLRNLLDLMVNFPSNDQRARFLLSSNWMRERGAHAARHEQRMLDNTLASIAASNRRHTSGTDPMDATTEDEYVDKLTEAGLIVDDRIPGDVVTALEPKDCPHDGARVEASIGDPSGADPAERGLPWEVLAPEQRDLDGIRAYVALGVCPVCSSRVVSVRSWDAVNWTSEHGPAWTTRWTRLVRDGQPL